MYVELEKMKIKKKRPGTAHSKIRPSLKRLTTNSPGYRPGHLEKTK